MGRVVFFRGKQKDFINQVLTVCGLKLEDLAELTQVSPRTIRDWRREKFTIPEKAIESWQEKFGITIPQNITKVSDYWYGIKGARNGALKRLELYGPPGTTEGRRKGGQISQQNRRLRPENYTNCIVRKKFMQPECSEKLAEATGIILGDGGITDYQLKVTLNWETEKQYIQYVTTLLGELFGEFPKTSTRTDKGEKGCNLILSGIELVEYLNKIGLSKGNKVTRQAEVPAWVIMERRLSKYCVKGLMDTDGCVFHHKHVSNGVKCFNLGMCFSNHSQPLLDFVHEYLQNSGFTPRRREYYVFLYRASEVIKYRDEIGFGNMHHLRRLNNFIKIKSGEVA